MTTPQQEPCALNTTSLLEELTAAYQQGMAIKCAGNEVGLLETLNNPDFTVSSTAAVQLHQLAAKLKDAAIKDGRLPGNKTLMIRTDNGSCGFYPNFIGVPLVRRALQTNSPQAAIEWLQKILTTTAATGKTIHALWGVKVDQEIELAPLVKIVPIEQLPDSTQKRWLITPSFHLHDSRIVSALDFEAPKAALVVTRQIEPVIVDPEEQPPIDNDEFLQTDELLHDITLALTIVGPRVSIPAAQWFNFDDPDIDQASMMSSSRRSKFLEIVPIQLKDFPVLDPNEARAIVQGYLALSGNTRDKVRVALQRVSQALRRQSVGDRAVELSTALETLLGDNAKTEMTHKIKVRSVRLIGGIDEVRKKNAALLNKAYAIRSSLVHTGHVDSAGSEMIGGQSISVSDIIDHTIGICVDLIKIIIRRGSIPIWSIFDITEQI